MTIRKFALLPLLVLSACVTSGSQSKPLPHGDNVPLGQSAYVDGPVIRPIKVVEDSRCPANARCIWAGTVKIDALWARTGGDQTIELELGKPVSIADGTLELTAVTPLRWAGKDREIQSKDYRFSFRFIGGL